MWTGKRDLGISQNGGLSELDNPEFPWPSSQLARFKVDF